MKSAAAAAVLLLLAADALAGQRRRGAPSPPPPAPVVPRTLSTGGVTTLPPPPPVSPFAARPGTYAPHYNEPAPRSRGLGYGVPYYNSAIGIGAYVPEAAVTPPALVEQPPLSVSVPEPPRAAAPVPEPQRIAALHGPDTFYVIPGCYAGNLPPNPGRLPRGCDLTRLRTTPIR
jgi:hypothetical protein